MYTYTNKINKNEKKLGYVSMIYRAGKKFEIQLPSGPVRLQFLVSHTKILLFQ